MNKKSVLVLLLGLLWIGSGKAEEKEEKIEPPDWFKAGYVTALQDVYSDAYLYDFLFFKELKEWLPSYLSSEQRNIIVDKLIKHLTDNDVNVQTGTIDKLAQLQTKKAIPKLIELLTDANVDADISNHLGCYVTCRAIEALEQL